jgi:hypothetical protein
MSNREDELMDRILRETASRPVPGLSAAFDRRLAKAIRPRRLSPWARLILILYTLGALVLSIWALRPLHFIGLVVMLSLVSSLATAWLFIRYQRGEYPTLR